MAEPDELAPPERGAGTGVFKAPRDASMQSGFRTVHEFKCLYFSLEKIRTVVFGGSCALLALHGRPALRKVLLFSAK